MAVTHFNPIVHRASPTSQHGILNYDVEEKIDIKSIDAPGLISADEGNVLKAGTDGLLNVQPATVSIDIPSLISDVGDNILELGEDLLLYVPPVDASELISEDTDNVLKKGTDDLLYVQATTFSVDVPGLISTDAGNMIKAGTDGLLNVTAVSASSLISADEGNTIKAGTDGLLNAPAVSASSLISTDEDNTLEVGEDGLLSVPAVTIPEAVAAASQADVDAGTTNSKYISPLTLSQRSPQFLDKNCIAPTTDLTGTDTLVSPNWINEVTNPKIATDIATHNTAADAHANLNIRISMAVNKIFNVGPTREFTTIQAAVDEICHKYDLGINIALIVVDAGEYTEQVLIRSYVASTGYIYIQGANESTTILNGSIRTHSGFSQRLEIFNLTIRFAGSTLPSISFWSGLYFQQSGLINLANIIIDPTSDTTVTKNAIVLLDAGRTTINGRITIRQGVFAHILSVDESARMLLFSSVVLEDVTVSTGVIGAVNLSRFALSGSMGGITGTATGTRVHCDRGSLVDLRDAGQESIPGTANRSPTNGSVIA